MKFNVSGFEPEPTRPVILFLKYLPATIPLIYVAFVLLIDPRVYWMHVVNGDSDNGYLYSALLLMEDKPINYIYHPGTPIIYFEAFLLEVMRPLQLSLQTQINALYLIGSSVNSILLAVFIKFASRYFGDVSAVGACLLLLAWPSFFPYQEGFSPDSFVIGLAALLGLSVWCGCGVRPSKLARAAMLTGCIAGGALAVKVSMLPVVAAAMVTVSARQLFLAWRGKCEWVSLFTPYLAMMFVGLLCLLPILARLPDIVMATLFSQGAAKLGSTFWPSLELLWTLNPFWPILIAVLPVLLVLYIIRNSSELVWCYPQKDEISDNITGWHIIFLVLSWVVFLYGLTSTISFEGDLLADARFRNMGPAVVAVIFTFMLVFRSSNSQVIGVFSFFKPAFGVALVVTTLVFGLYGLSQRRSAIIESTFSGRSNIEKMISEEAQSADVIAFWDGSSGTGEWGPAAYHFWSNYAYGAEQFDQKLVAEFHPYTFLRLRDVSGQIQSKKLSKIENTLPTFLMSAGRAWFSRFPRPYGDRDAYATLAGESYLSGDVVLFVPRWELEKEMSKRGNTEEEFVQYLNSRYRGVESTSTTVGNVVWRIFRFSLAQKQ